MERGRRPTFQFTTYGGLLHLAGACHSSTCRKLPCSTRAGCSHVSISTTSTSSLSSNFVRSYGSLPRGLSLLHTCAFASKRALRAHVFVEARAPPMTFLRTYTRNHPRQTHPLQMHPLRGRTRGERIDPGGPDAPDPFVRRGGRVPRDFQPRVQLHPGGTNRSAHGSHPIKISGSHGKMPRV